MGWGATAEARTRRARRVAAATIAGHAGFAIACLAAAPFEARLPLAFALAVVFAIPCYALARRAVERLPALGARPRGWRRLVTVGAMVLAMASVAQTARLGAFMLDSRLTLGAALPGGNTRHACLSAYLRAAELDATGEPNLYRRALYAPRDRADAEGPATAVEGMAAWMSDPYQYPPTFLVFPRAAIALSRDYAAQRAAWFALQIAAFGAIAIVVALRLGDRRRWRALALLPAVWIALPTLVNFQFGQVHLIVLGLGVAAMVAFERGRDWLGGAMLAGAIGAKIFPGVLGLVLLWQRRWRALAATALWTAALALGSWLALGGESFAAFVRYQLPRMASGEAFVAFFDDPFAVAENLSIPGLGYKLEALGLMAGPEGFAAAAKWPWLAVLIGACAVAAKITNRDDRAPLAWLALLVLASMLSPYTPGSYALAGALWLLVMLALTVRLPPAANALLVSLWLAWQLAPVMGDLPLLWRWPRFAIACSLAAIAAVLGLCAVALATPAKSPWRTSA